MKSTQDGYFNTYLKYSGNTILDESGRNKIEQLQQRLVT